MKALAAIPLMIFVLSSCHGQVVFQATPQDVGVAEGGDAVFRCEATEGGSPTVIGWLLRSVMEVQTTLINGSAEVSGIGSVMVSTGNRNDLTLSSLSSSIDGSTVTCLSVGNILANTTPAVITIYSTPSYSTLPNQSTTPLEGSSFSHSFSFSGGTSSFNWTKDGVDPSTDGRISTTASSIMIDGVQRTDSGTYHVFGSNIVGTATASFVLDVIFSPEFSGTDIFQTDVLSRESSFTFNCTPSAANPAPSFSFMRDGSTYTEPAGNITGPVLTISSVVRADTGNYSCTAANTAGSTTLYHNLLVVEIPEYTTRNEQSPNANESVIPYTYKFDLNPGALPANFTWTKDGTSLSTDDSRFTLAVDSITIRNVDRNNSGNYTVRATNIAGMDSISFVLDVHYRPEFMNVPTMNFSQLNRESSFTLNCTPSAANPAPSLSFMRNGSTYTEPAGNINGQVLTISSVARADTGNYSCTATNTAGSTTLYHNLLVVAPPTFPLNLMFPGEMAFSAMVTWTPPTDDGGISHPSWTPPSPSSSPIIQYTVAYSNSSGNWNVNSLNTPLVTLSNLQHSTDYTVTVAASNAHGQSTGVQGTFRTLDSKPILQAVVLAPLSLNSFTANVTFLTVGGQNVTNFNFSITINDSSLSPEAVIDSTPVPDGKGVMVSLLIEGQSFTKGTYYTVEITATNRVGTSEPITGLMFVPNPPVITANFTKVTADDIPSNKCCAGVQLMLAEQPDLSDLIVLLTPQGGNQFTVSPADLSLEEFTLYIGGLQTGTDYTAVVTVSNIFGSSDDQLQLKPLLGVPSNPNPPAVSVDGGQVTVELSTAYPGTVQTRSGSMFRFEIQFIEDSQRSSRQSKTEMQAVIPASLFNTSAIFTTNLDPGSYSVSVTAVNEHGRSSAVLSESTFTVTVTPAPTVTITIIIVIAIVVVVMVVPVLIVLILAIICIICCMRVKKNKKEKYHVGSEDTELTANRNAVEKNSLDGDRDSLFIETGMYDVVGKETIKPPKPQSTPASTTNGQPQPGGDVYAEVNQPKKTNKAAATPTTPPTEDMYEAVDMSKKTKKPKTEAPADKVDPEATLYAEVVQEKKEPAVPPKTEAECQNPEVDKPIEENELQYATLDFSKAPSSFKKPAPPNPDENVIYSQVTIAKKQ